MLILAGCAVPFAWAGPVTLFDNLAYYGGPGDDIGINSNNLPLAGQFFAGPGIVSLDSVSLKLDRSSFIVGSTTFALYSDAGNSPDSLIATIATLTDGELTTTAARYTFSNLDIALTPNTQYWIKVSAADGAASWGSDNDASGTASRANSFSLAM